MATGAEFLEGIRRVDVLGVPISAVTREELPELVERLIEAEGSHILAPVNAQVLNSAVEHPELRAFLQQADIVHSDGAGPVVAAGMLGDPIPPRITSIYLLWQLCQRWRHGQHSIYFLGGPPGVAEEAKRVLSEQHPGVRIVGCHRGHLVTEAEREAALADVRAKAPDLLCVGFGTPKQERFITEHRKALASVPLIWPVGALTSHIATVFPRAPRLMRKYGMEWAWRLALEPRRMWKRYLLGNPQFLSRVIQQRISDKKAK